MIKLSNINKYYFKGERHQIHVVNNVTLEFPNAGFVTILGASGSGKTTLLNIIAGLDKYDSGTITYDDKVFDKYKMDEVDALRSEKMGYIFQNYLLINHFTVYENLRVALEAIDVVDPLEQKKRIEYALKCVGLFKYRKKKVKNLSGGQMQRVSIARCIVKNSEVIIADEPTGNVDSENTIQIMNILKKISETKLVILVTHEIAIARYYSDRIIQIKDGKIISDGIVSNNGTLNAQTDRKIYLGDLKNEKTSSNRLNFELYVDDSSTESDLIIAVRNDTIYVKSSKKIVNLNESSIELVNDSYHDPLDAGKDFDFDTSWYKNPKAINKKHFFRNNFLNGFRELRNQGKSKIVFIIINIILGILIGTCFINLGKFATFDTSGVTKDNIGQVVTTKLTNYKELAPKNDNNVYLDAYEAGVIDNIIPFARQSYYLEFKENFVFGEEHNFEYWAYPYQDDMKLISGNRPVNNGIVIGKTLADTLLSIYGHDTESYENLLGEDFNNYIINGVVENDTMSIYVNPILIYTNLQSNDRFDICMINNVDYYQNCYNITSGSIAVNNNEVMLNEKFASQYNYQVSETINLAGDSYLITGLFKENNTVSVPTILTKNPNLCGQTLDVTNGTLTETVLSYRCFYLPANEYEIVLGRKSTSSNECIANVSSGLEIGNIVNGYKVVGIYEKNIESGTLGSDFMYDNIIIINGQKYVNTNNVVFEFNSAAKDYFKEKNYKIYDLDDYQRLAARKSHQTSNVALLVFSLFLLGASMGLTYLTNRSRLINEIQTIGVYRSIGKSRKCLIYQKLGYNFLMTSISSIIGYTISWIFSGLSNNITAVYQQVTRPNVLIVILGIVVLYAIGIFIGLLPTISLIKKTPSEINSKYDI